jgi:hypothetical protein
MAGYAHVTIATCSLLYACEKAEEHSGSGAAALGHCAICHREDVSGTKGAIQEGQQQLQLRRAMCGRAASKAHIAACRRLF